MARKQNKPSKWRREKRKLEVISVPEEVTNSNERETKRRREEKKDEKTAVSNINGENEEKDHDVTECESLNLMNNINETAKKERGEIVEQTEESVKTDLRKESEEPVKESKEQVKESEEPVKELEEPVKESEEPVKELEEPVKELGGPVKELEEPGEESQEPVKDTCDAEKKEHSRKDLQESVQVKDESMKDTEETLKRKNESDVEKDRRKLKEGECKVFGEVSNNDDGKLDFQSVLNKANEIIFEENDFMTQFEGKWVKRDSLPKLEKMKLEMKNETDPQSRKRLEKSFKNVLAKAGRKLKIQLTKQKEQDWLRIEQYKTSDIKKFANSKCGLKRLSKVKDKLVARGASMEEQQKILKKIGRRERRKERLIEKKKAEKRIFSTKFMYYRLNIT